MSAFEDFNSHKAHGWQCTSDYVTDYEFPEFSHLQSKPNTGIAIQGGGSRAYTSALGYLAALHKLDLLKNVRYISGISGGAWATMTFTYAQNVANDDILLGPIVPPELITRENLKEMEDGCARKSAATVFAKYAVPALITEKPSDAWCTATSKTYLEPVGIKRGLKFSWNDETVKDIMERNPSFSKEDFQVPVLPNRPYPIIGCTYVGPSEGAPYNSKAHSLTMLEITPLYVGQLKSNDVTYKYHSGCEHTMNVGGAVEPFAFGKIGEGPAEGVSAGSTKTLLAVPQPEEAIDIAFAAGASSFAPGTFVESFCLTADSVGYHMSYWAPSDPTPTMKVGLFGDGGSMQNVPLIPLMQRNVKKIVLLCHDTDQLLPADKWDPYTQPFTGKEIGGDIASFFGVFSAKQLDIVTDAIDNRKNQVFSSDDFPRVAAEMQAAKARGKGIIGTFDLTTVENLWWGIPAGLTYQITFVFLGRSSEWEARLSPEMQKVLIPCKNADDLNYQVDDGPFDKFPLYPTLAGDVSEEKANALANLTGWTILENEALFRSIFSDA